MANGNPNGGIYEQVIKVVVGVVISVIGVAIIAIASFGLNASKEIPGFRKDISNLNNAIEKSAEKQDDKIGRLEERVRQLEINYARDMTGR